MIKEIINCLKYGLIGIKNSIKEFAISIFE